MEEERSLPIEEMDFFRDFVAVADWARDRVSAWTPLARNTVGTQLVRAIDREGATRVEGDGRHSALEAAHFFTIARGSARETRYCLERAITRRLIPEAEGLQQVEKVTSATRRLNGLIRFRRPQTRRTSVREEVAVYSILNDASGEAESD